MLLQILPSRIQGGSNLSHTPGVSNFFSEHRRRNILKVGAAYVIVAWSVARAAKFALDSFDSPSSVMRSLLRLLALGQAQELQKMAQDLESSCQLVPLTESLFFEPLTYSPGLCLKWDLEGDKAGLRPGGWCLSHIPPRCLS